MEKIINNKTVLFLAFIMIFSTLFGTTSVFANEESTNTVNEDELEKELEYYFKDAEIKDENGNVIGFDVKVINEKLPEDKKLSEEEINNIKATSDTSLRVACPTTDACDNVSGANKCLTRNIQNNMFSSFQMETYTGIVNAIREGKYAQGAGDLIKVGAKGSAAWIATELSYYMIRCTANHDFNA